jgi:CRP/FNR family transcriptional regulator, nitrogen fixation regulation protein
MPQIMLRNLASASSVHAAAEISSANGQHCLFGMIELHGAPMNFRRNAEIFGEGEDAEYVYKVLSGAARTYKILSDGRRQIGAFYLPGDVFGLESSDAHSYSAEAISDSAVLVVRRSTLLNSAERNHDIARQLWSVTARELNMTQAHVLLLIKSAQERLAAFLLEMSERLAGKGAVELPMSRQDIADYLGLTIETVSRTLTQLAEASTIQLLASRRILLCNRPALSRLNA